MNAQPSTQVTLDADRLLARAQDEASLLDYGDRWFETPFRVLIDAINREAGLQSEDAPPVRTLVENLKNRLKLVEFVRKHPAVLDEKVEVAGLIIGHARGGSTLLQTLLTASPKLTAPRWWELITPVPLDGEVRGAPAQRRAIADAWIDEMNAAAPDHGAVHPIRADAYEEEIMLINHSFLSMMYGAYFNVPGYMRWQMTQDHSRSYAELKLWLQLLQYQAPDRRGRKWLLKTVQHLMTCDLRMLIHTFPDARLIMTHRRLDKVLTSLCSAQSMLIGISGSATFDPRQTGPVALAMYREALTHYVDVRGEQPTDRFIDVSYEKLIAQPIEEFGRVMRAIGVEPDAGDEAAARQWLEANQRDKYPPHHYQLEDFGLSREVIDETFRFYDHAA